MTTEPSPATDPSARTEGARRTAWARRGAWATLALVLAATAAAVVVWRGLSPAPPRGANVATSDELARTLDRIVRRQAQPLRPGIAVRPLVAPPGDAASTAIAQPVCESVVERLARLQEVRIASCRSTAVALASGLDDRALARLLAVNYLLKGAIEPQPNGRVRVRLALEDVPAGQERWRIDEEMPAAQLQALPERVAQAAAPLLGGSGAPVPEVSLSAQAHERYLQAQRLARRPAVEERRQALQLVGQVLDEAPRHVGALFLRHLLRSRLDGMVSGGPGEQGSPQQIAAAQAALLAEARALGERILALDPGDRRGHIMLLNAELEQKRWSEAFARADALLVHAQQQPGVLRIVARLYLMGGYVQRAQALATEAVRLDALDAESIEYLGTTLGMQGRDAEMRELLTLAAQIGHGGLDFFEAVLAHRRRDWPALTRALGDYARSSQRDPGWVEAFVRGVADEREREAAAQLLDAHDAGLRFYMTDYFFEYALLGDAARSLRALQWHAKQPPKLWLEYLWWPEIAAVRRSPGFAAVVAETGLGRLWEARGAPDLCEQPAGGTWACR